eukprot:CAMPEP_0178589564 /NCGR_PEP_ID=MMETSP0697-20121206/27707_1 /TAXON_ID=265572 /ORGANISM="Extubocellulus spinifer, Strain CCMP396" /LENGTH=281 /DNA_ID=CAMNT_0020226135 /DNA_START=172 /DNA_END=1013 /DNA_ORIENTATION=+
MDRNTELEEYYMRQALSVARAALNVGEVPVGCVIVLRDPPLDQTCTTALATSGSDNGLSSCIPQSSPSVVVSHGANQVNATRDATRHAELVAIDRMLTGGLSSDHQRLPPCVMAQSAHGRIPDDSPLLANSEKTAGATINGWSDAWVNVPAEPDHWKNGYGWGSGRKYSSDIFGRCDLYVTCEPCIMCAAALARVGIGRVFFGCHNLKFGGCGSLMKLHKATTLPSPQHHGYPIVEGVLKDEAVELLRSFYDRENFHAPDDKRKRKPAAVEEGNAAADAKP